MSNKKTTSSIKLPKQLRPLQHFKVEDTGAPLSLLAYLCQVALRDRSRTTVKQLLSDRFISVNGEPTTQWDQALQVGDVIALHPTPLPTSLSNKLVEILWQDDYLVMIHKRAGIPTVSSGQERDKTTMEVVSEHLKKFNPLAKVYLLNRIDKDSTGFVLMAKSQELQEEMTNHWDRYVQHQQFAVAIEGHMAEPEGYLAAPTASSETDKRKPSRRVQGGASAGEARYRTLMTTETGSLLAITLLRGRNNRLRRQFAELKRPILGDWRNGSPRRDLGFVALETTAFSFVHPITGVKYNFDQPVPGNFRRLLKLPRVEGQDKRPTPSKKKQ